MYCFLCFSLTTTVIFKRHLQEIYNNPQEFDGFRFVDRDPLKWQLTAINDDFIAFGTGRSAWYVHFSPHMWS
jgi:hypothetical protein